MDTRIARAHELSHTFLTMVRERRGIDLEAWMAEAMHSGIEELARFARGLQEDFAAVTAGFTLDWSNGPVEGQITRLKLLKHRWCYPCNAHRPTSVLLLTQKRLPIPWRSTASHDHQRCVPTGQVPQV